MYFVLLLLIINIIYGNSRIVFAGSPQTLSDLLKDVSFPASIDVIGVKQTDNAFSSRMLATLSDTRLTLHEISRQKFLVANAIRKG